MAAQLPSGIGTRSTVLDELAGAIGIESALKLCARFGGLRLHIPKTIDAGHEIAAVIGQEKAEQLASFFHGTLITFPARPGEIAAVLKLAAEGKLTRTQIAAEVGISERRVYRILAAADDRQADLFADPDC